MNTQCIDRSMNSNPLPTNSRPGDAAVTKGLVWAWRVFKKRMLQIRNRQDNKILMSLNEDQLKDIGLTRGDISWAMNLPLSRDAATELEIVSRRSPR